MPKKNLAFINFLVVPPAIFILSLVISITLVNVNKNYQQTKSLNDRLGTLNSNRALWANKKVNHYRYTFLFTGGNIHHVPATIEIKNGTAISITHADITDVNGNIVKLSSEEQLQKNIRLGIYDSVEKLFETAEGVIENNYEEVLIKYDSDYGFPSVIWERRDKRLTHSDFGIAISDFRVLD